MSRRDVASPLPARVRGAWIFLLIVLAPLGATAVLLGLPETKGKVQELMDVFLPPALKSELKKFRAGAPASSEKARDSGPSEELIQEIPSALAGAIVGPKVIPAFAIDEEGGFLVLSSELRKSQKISIRSWNPPVVNEAEVLGTDSVTGLALLKSSTKLLPWGPVESGGELAVGGPLVAVSVSESGARVIRGIVSALPQSQWGPGSRVQTDFKVGPEDVGAPVFSEGKWVGVLSPDVGLWPREEVLKVLKDLKERGVVIRPTLGLEFQEVSGPLFERLYGRGRGAMASAIVVTSSQQAGISPYDILVENMPEVLEAVSRKTVGEKVPLKILRGGNQETVTVEVLDQNPPPQGHSIVTGLSLEWLAEGSFGVESGRIRVQSVEAGSRFQNAGLVAGDVILDVDKTPVRNLGHLGSLLATMREGRPTSHTLRVRRPDWAVKPGQSSTQILFIAD